MQGAGAGGRAIVSCRGGGRAARNGVLRHGLGVSRARRDRGGTARGSSLPLVGMTRAVWLRTSIDQMSSSMPTLAGAAGRAGDAASRIATALDSQSQQVLRESARALEIAEHRAAAAAISAQEAEEKVC